MFQFNFEESTWIPEIKDVQWQQPQLQTLSDQPFNILDCIPNEQQQQEPINISESVTTLSTHEEEMEYEQEEQDIWTLNNLPTKINTLSWDTQNSNYPSTTQIRLANKNISTPFITEVPKSLFDPIIQSQTITVHELQLVKSLIQAIVGVPSIYFQWYNNQFQMYPIRILGLGDKTIQPLLKEILLLSTKLKRIENVFKICHLYPERYGLTGLAFASCLSQWHINVQHAIINLFENENPTLLKVYHCMHDLSFIIEKLYQLCCIEPDLATVSDLQRQHIEKYGFYIPFGAELLNLLYTELKQYDLSQSGNHALYRDICLAMLCYTSVPYTSILSKWLGLDSTGVLDDPYHEFFITMHDGIDDLLTKFQIRNEAKLPYFINDTLATFIFRSGQSLQLLKKTKPDHPLFHLKEMIPLKILFKNDQIEECMEKLLHSCKTIKAYNIGSPLITPDVVHVQQTRQDTDNNIDRLPYLTFLSEINLKGDFMLTIQELRYNQFMEFIPTFDIIIQQSYLKPLNIWCPILNESLMSFFIHQFKLESHLSLLFDYFLLANPTFVTGLKETFFKSRIEYNSIWPPKYYHLNTAFKNLLLDEEDDLISFSIRKMNTSRLNPNSVTAFDFLQLNYHASYPLNIIITPTIIEKYNRIFTFCLQVLRTSTATKRMYEPLKNANWYRSCNRDMISLYRFQLDQFMTAIQGYIHDTAIQTTWFRFMQHVKSMPLTDDDYSVIMEPYTFKEYHQHVLDCILYKCFLKSSQSTLLDILYATMQDIIIFALVIDDYKCIDLKGEEKLILKCKRVFEQFQNHSQMFIRVLNVMEENGSGRLSNILNSGTKNIFKDLYTKYEVKLTVDEFVKDLLLRLGFFSK